jgi:Concanavalin A-like lectin/glucanases superfamily
MKNRAAAVVLTGAWLVLPGPAHAEQNAGFVSAVLATKPLAYYRLESTNGTSQVGGTTYSSSGGVASDIPGAPIGVPDNRFAALNGRDGYVTTTLSGGIATAATIMAWVDLEKLPSETGHFFYVAGESEVGNDLDLQFETDDRVKLYTSAGSYLEYKPPAASLPKQWHMVVATLGTLSGHRAIYWDGLLVAGDTGGGKPNKTKPFTIGASPVFPGRWFDGGIDEVAIWDVALSPDVVQALWDATKTPASK